MKSVITIDSEINDGRIEERRYLEILNKGY